MEHGDRVQGPARCDAGSDSLAHEFAAEDLRREVLGRGLSALLVSNPTNPTGKVGS